MRWFRLPPRAGPRPDTTVPTADERRPGDGFVHRQISQNAPLRHQEELFRRGSALPLVETHQSRISVPGAQGFSIRDLSARGPDEAFMVEGEFAHLHPAHDGSLHLALSPAVYEEVRYQGWGEPHPLVGTMMAFGPRDEDELEVLWQILLASYRFARGAPE